MATCEEGFDEPAVEPSRPGLLQQMLDQQKDLQKVMDSRAFSPDPQTLCEYFKDMAFADIAETMEMLDETGWKPWTSKWYINRDAAVAEWIDKWHFMMNIANVLRLTETEIVHRYEQKAAINRARVAEGYDGVSTKCPGCKRALDDPATQCAKSTQGGYVWCVEKLRSYPFLV